MTEIVIFHHAHGLTSGVLDLAERLREAGHSVHTPDLYGGQTFKRIETGLEYFKKLGGFKEFIHRGQQAVDSLPSNLVYIGQSLGVIPAQKLALTRTGARGAILMYACLPMSEFGSSWPIDLSIQIHAMDSDPFFVNDGDLDAARELIEKSRNAELLLYPGEHHIFADSSLPSFDKNAANLLLNRLFDFVSETP